MLFMLDFLRKSTFYAYFLCRHNPSGASREGLAKLRFFEASRSRRKPKNALPSAVSFLSLPFVNSIEKSLKGIMMAAEGDNRPRQAIHVLGFEGFVEVDSSHGLLVAPSSRSPLLPYTAPRPDRCASETNRSPSSSACSDPNSFDSHILGCFCALQALGPWALSSPW